MNKTGQAYEAGQAGDDLGARNTAGLRFETKDDAVDYARRIAQDAVRRSIKRSLTIAEAYLQNCVEFEFVFRSVSDSQNFKAIMRRDPARPVLDLLGAHKRIEVLKGDIVSDPYAYNSLVLVRACKRENGVESWVPSLANIQRCYEFDYVGVNLLEAPFYLALEIVGGFSNREMYPFYVLGSGEQRRVAGSVIEGISQVVDDPIGEKANVDRDSFPQLEADDFFARVVIDDLDAFVRVRHTPDPSALCELVDFSVRLIQ